MREYYSTYSKELVFILDEDGDNYSSFDKAIEYIDKNTHNTSRDFKHDFIDGGNGFFIIDGITIKISCTNWDGTELRIEKDLLSESDLFKVRKLALEIYNFIHNNSSPQD
ncbi:hypothetical protein EG240_15895 [Paenimyroides tangerinum]|uniref:Uncharacterized protein n=1 Tax=Paenimyroides tangerinum TaxID=2488728 RepID=A0A3P3VVI3_9FLAO|nr:hypothetical protein [Paenimyroides tangerinum]RRJ86690.1 hypothetical protein EG240_15895 [Paenimyroides tangerinum]